MSKISAVILFCFFIIANIPFSGRAQTGIWATGSSNAHRVAEGFPVTVDPNGNVYTCSQIGNVSGVFGPNVTIWGHDTVRGPGYGQVVIASTDSGGNPRWMIGTSGYTALIINMVADECGNMYLYGVYTWQLILGSDTLFDTTAYEEYYLAKINTEGQELWLKNVAFMSDESGSFDSYPGGLCIDKAGNPYVTGIFNGRTITIGSTTLTNTSATDTYSSDIFVARYDPSGNAVWAKSFGGDSSDYIFSMAASADGNIYVGGIFFSDTLVFAGDTLKDTTAYINPSVFIASYDTHGNQRWARNSVGKQMDQVGAMTTDIWGNVYLCGAYTDTMQFGSTMLPPYTIMYSVDNYLLKFDSLGNCKWGKALNPALEDFFTFGLVTDNNGNIWMSGGSGASVSDVLFMARYDTAGTLITVTDPNNGGEDYTSLAVDNKGFLYLGGDYVQPLVVGRSTLVQADSSMETMYVAKYSYPFILYPMDSLPATTICLGATVTLASHVPCIKWSSANPLVATIDSIGTVTGISPGTAAITFEEGNIGYGTTQVQVIAGPSPISGKKTICLDSATTLTDTATGGIWSSGNLATATIGSVTGKVRGLDTGKVVIAYTFSDGCMVTDTIKVGGCGLGVTTINAGGLYRIFPNPVSSILTITGTEPIMQVSVSNLVGQLLFSRKYNSDRVEVNVSDLPPGVYSVKINASDVRKFVKE